MRGDVRAGNFKMMEKRYEINWKPYGERKRRLLEKVWRIREMENLPVVLVLWGGL